MHINRRLLVQFSKALHVDLRNMCLRHLIARFYCILVYLIHSVIRLEHAAEREHESMQNFALLSQPALQLTPCHIWAILQIVRAIDIVNQTIVCHFLTHAGTPVVQHTL